MAAAAVGVEVATTGLVVDVGVVLVVATDVAAGRVTLVGVGVVDVAVGRVAVGVDAVATDGRVVIGVDAVTEGRVVMGVVADTEGRVVVAALGAVDGVVAGVAPLTLAALENVALGLPAVVGPSDLGVVVVVVVCSCPSDAIKTGLMRSKTPLVSGRS